MTPIADETVTNGRHGPYLEGMGVGSSPYGQGTTRDYADGEGYSDFDGGHTSRSCGHGDVECRGTGKFEGKEQDNMYWRDNL